MAVVVEDGTGKSDADVYDSLANITAYLATYHPSTGWTGADTATQELYAKQAAQYLDMVYGERWDGERGSKEQALDWPRIGAYSKGYEILSNEIPSLLTQAFAEVCRELAEGNTILLSAVTDDATIGTDRTKIGPLEFETRYIGGKEETAAAVLPRVERLLRPLTSGVWEIERG